MPPEIISELRRLSNRELRLTLSELKPDERARVLALIEEADAPKAAPSFELLVGLSPWLLKSIDEARSGGQDAGYRQTPAARAALLDALDQLATTRGDRKDTDRPVNTTFVGRLLARRKARAAA